MDIATNPGLETGRLRRTERALTAARRPLLTCGIISTLLYVGADILAAMLYDGYSYASQAISELSAVGAPTRPLLSLTGTAYLLLVIAFGCGVLLAAGRKRTLRVVGILLIGYGLVGFAWRFAPMHQREVLAAGGGSQADIMHLVLSAIDILLYFLIIGFGGAAFGKRFRVYSIATILVVLVFGALTGLEGPRIAANLPTPWVGVWERIMLFSPMLWIAVLAALLLRIDQRPEPVATGDGGGHVQKKKVTVFIGSARRKGATAAAARRFLDNLQAFGDVQGEIVFLGDYNLGLCRGCKVCFMRGEERCPLRGDRDALIEKMTASDGVVFASPNYSFQVSAIMKAFLDRLAFLFHRPRFPGKTFTAIVSQGFYGGGKIVKYLEFVGLGLGFNVVKGSCVPGLEPVVEKDRRRTERAIARQSRRFHERMLKPAYPVPSLLQLMMFRGGRNSSKFLAGDDDRDHSYYRDQGWFDSDYFYPTRLGPFKKAIGAALDWMTARTCRKRNEELALQTAAPARVPEMAAEENIK